MTYGANTHKFRFTFKGKGTIYVRNFKAVKIPNDTQITEFDSFDLSGYATELTVGEISAITVTGNVGGHSVGAVNPDLLTFKSSNEAVTTVDANGKITAVGQGDANITVSSLVYGNIGDITVNVAEAASIEYFVSASGNDDNAGTFDLPFRTIEKARNVIRKIPEASRPEGGIVVNIMGGTYPVSDTIVFDENDSGTKEKPIIYKAYNGEKVSLIGGQTLDSSKIKKVEEADLLNRLIDENAKDHLYMLDLGAQGVKMNKLEAYGWYNTKYKPMRIYMNNTALSDARWPNDDDSQYAIKADPLLEGIDLETWNGDGQRIKMIYHDAENRTNKWEIKYGDVYLGGAIAHFWSSSNLRIDNIDAKNKIVTTIDEAPFSITDDSWGGLQHKIFFSNIFEEIDRPGESYVDRENNILYFYPVGSVTDANMVVSTLQDSMITITNADYITFSGIDFKNTIETPVILTDCDNVIFENSEISNSSRGGVEMTNCTNSVIRGCHIYNTGISAMIIHGGDRENLKSSGNVIENNNIHNFALLPAGRHDRAGIQLKGCVGEVLRHNEFRDFGFGAVDMSDCNNIVIEYNKFSYGEQISTDAGVIYYGKQVANIGMVIRYNYFENTGNKIISKHLDGGKSFSVFFDDSSVGPKLYGNVFYNGGFNGGATSGNGGNWSDMYGNVTICTDPDRMTHSLNIKPWGNDIGAKGLKDKIEISSYLYQTQMRDSFGKDSNNEFDFAGETGYSKYLWSKKWADAYSGTQWEKALEFYNWEDYEALKTMYDADDLTGMVEYFNDNFEAGETNRIHSNLMLGKTEYDGAPDDDTNYLGKTEDTISDEEKALFEDFEGKNFALTEEGLAKVQKIAPDFEQIPFEKIGLLTEVGGNIPAVTVKSEVVSGAAVAGNTIYPSYTYYDSDGDSESTTKVYWYVSDTENGSYEMVIGKQGEYFTLTDDYVGKYLKYEVVPYDSDSQRGEPVFSSPIEVKEAAYDITVAYENTNGIVKFGNDVVSGGSVLYAADNSKITLQIIPDDGYEATVKLGQQDLPVSNGMVSFTASESSVLAVLFTAKPAVQLGFEKDATYGWFRPVNGVDTIYVYSKLTQYTTGDDNLNYGVIISCDVWSGTVTLNSLEGDSTLDKPIPSVAAPGKAFVLKAYGNAIDSENSYKVQPFVGNITDAETELVYDKTNYLP